MNRLERNRLERNRLERNQLERSPTRSDIFEIRLPRVKRNTSKNRRQRCQASMVVGVGVARQRFWRTQVWRLQLQRAFIWRFDPTRKAWIRAIHTFGWYAILLASAQTNAARYASTGFDRRCKLLDSQNLGVDASHQSSRPNPTAQTPPQG